MTTVGLITEYNPFHNGHLYHLEQAKKLSGAKTAIAVMSGNFVQRGEPAIFDKWRRAKAALESGVDLVLELPFAFAVQPGHIFAQGAVKILSEAGVDAIAFGAEHAEWDFMALAKIAQQATAENTAFHTYNQTYATTFNQIIQEQTGLDLHEPNDILGLSYALALLELGLGQQIKLYSIQRQQANYHDAELQNGTIASATAIRQALQQASGQTDEFVPQATAQMIAQGKQVSEYQSKFFNLLKYKVLTTPLNELIQIYQLDDGLANRLHTTIETTANEIDLTWEEFAQLFKSKRYTYSRLQRNLLYTILNISTSEMHTAMQQPYLRVLAVNENGRQHLKKQRQQIEIPVINKIDKDMLTGILNLDYRAGRLYELIEDDRFKTQSQDTGRIPYQI
ncbi:MAG: nucleotidyltransferase [Lactobacillaceae bacterium]|jgi:predicted nucleotidyltransferase|nr:nucleotidyltransferase [Lactobacillaceae bacterium]